MLKLAGTAREIGLRAVGIVDGDVGQVPKQYLKDNHSLADAVIRLPDKAAIEAALVNGLSDEVICQALQDIAASALLPPPENLNQMSGASLLDASILFIKRNSLHGAFIDALPTSNFPPLAVQILHKAVEIASSDMTGIIQL